MVNYNFYQIRQDLDNLNRRTSDALCPAGRNPPEYRDPRGACKIHSEKYPQFRAQKGPKRSKRCLGYAPGLPAPHRSPYTGCLPVRKQLSLERGRPSPDPIEREQVTGLRIPVPREGGGRDTKGRDMWLRNASTRVGAETGVLHYSGGV